MSKEINNQLPSFSSPPNTRRMREEQPEMRSVAVTMGAIPPSILPPPSLVFEKPALKPQQHTTIINHEPSRKVEIVSTPSSSPSSWNIGTIYDLQPLPEIYPLERSHVSIDASSSSRLQKIVDRACSSLRSQSIHVKYDEDEEGNNTAFCEAPCNLRFCIRLFNDVDNNKIIVEIQRRSGCSYTFHKTSRTILRDIKAPKRSKSLPSSSTSLSSAFKVPKSIILQAKLREEQEHQTPRNSIH